MQNAALQSADIDDTEDAGKSGGAFRTISEVATDLGVQQHVLRFWETKFSQIRPMKRGGGRRYYRPEDVAMLKRIHTLLYGEGYTIKGAQKLLKGQSRGAIAAAQTAAEKARDVARHSAPVATPAPAQPAKAAEVAVSPALSEALQGILSDLKELRAIVAKAA